MSDRHTEGGDQTTFRSLLGASAKDYADEAAKILSAGCIEAMMSTVSPAAGAAAGAAGLLALEAMKPGVTPGVIPDSFKGLFNDLRHHRTPTEENQPRSLQNPPNIITGALSTVGTATGARRLAEGALLGGASAAARAVAGQDAGRTEKQIKDLANQVIKEIVETPDDVLKHIKENPITSIIEGSLWIPSIVVDAKLRKYFSK